MRVRTALVALAALAVVGLPDAAFASTGPGGPLWEFTPVAPVIQRWTPCRFSITGSFDEYLDVRGLTAQTRTGAVDVWRVGQSTPAYHLHIVNGFVERHVFRNATTAMFTVQVNGLACGAE